CISSCPGGCPQGQLCQDGMCKMSRCDGVHCDPGQICNPNDGTCQNDLCMLGCPLGQRCVPMSGQCIPDPCATVHCDTNCTSCQLESDGTPACTLNPGCSPPPSITATGTGGGGLSCAISGDHDPPSPLWLLVLGLAFVIRRRSR